MAERFPGYDVVSKRGTQSWNPQTRRVLDARLAIDPDAHAFFTDPEWATLKALCARIIPQPPERARPAPIAAMVDATLTRHGSEGYRDARMPPMREAWRRGLAALDSEALARHGRRFHQLGAQEADGLLSAVQQGYLADPTWAGMSPELFFRLRIIPDIVSAYYAHPAAWNEIGYGGPAAPRGYVRLDLDRRDPWEAAEARPGEDAASVMRENRHVGRS